MILQSLLQRSFLNVRTRHLAVSLVSSTIDAIYFELQSSGSGYKDLDEAQSHLAKIRDRSTTQIQLHKSPVDTIIRILQEAALGSCVWSTSATPRPVEDSGPKALFAYRKCASTGEKSQSTPLHCGPTPLLSYTRTRVFAIRRIVQDCGSSALAMRRCLSTWSAPFRIHRLKRRVRTQLGGDYDIISRTLPGPVLKPAGTCGFWSPGTKREEVLVGAYER